MNKVNRALISVSDKRGIVPLAKGLSALGIEILSTGGTAQLLRAADVPVLEVSDYTGFPEMLDGRVKTLHPKIHGGILALREKNEHREQLQKHHFGFIDMVVCNLYPFESVIKKKNVTLDEAVENIDIGGPALLRSAAKNFKNVAVVCHPKRYDEVLNELRVNSGLLSDAVLYQLALEAFQHTAFYDRVIADYLSLRLVSREFTKLPKEFITNYSKAFDLRYGENPHQEAAFYRDGEEASGFATIKKLHGKDLSFNNILDLHAAIDFVMDFEQPAAAIVKHNNPTGVATHAELVIAYKEAYRCDPTSAYGGIIALNKKVDKKTAEAIAKSGFMECVIAPGFMREAVQLLKARKNLRIIEMDWKNFKREGLDFKLVNGGLLLQEKDVRIVTSEECRLVTKTKPTLSQMDSLLFGWKVIRNVKSNAIVLVKGRKTVGIGCGQTSRVDSVRTAIGKARQNARGACLVSDGFFPKTDNIQLAKQAGIKAIIQPGGSISDKEIIQEADKAKIAMVFTGIRHFKH